MMAGLIRAQSPDALAHLILSTIDAAALLVANAPGPEAALSEARTAPDTLLSGLS